MKQKILVVEDERITREGIEEFLKEKGFDVMTASDGEEALEKFRWASLVVLDIMIPKIDGIEVLKEIRRISDVPVIMLTAISDEMTQYNTFSELADDFVSKPFSLLILMKRIEALIRRKENKEHKIWESGKAVVDFSSYKGYLDGEDAQLTAKEIALLKLLVDNEGIVLSRQKILEALWTDDESPYDRVIDVYIKNLRKKLELDCLSTIKGVGYRYDQT
ncbi:MAG: response regulator transcription factor [Clostridiales bacterium]|nr:response regulator transcription factor [Clostridiales bacterium]MBS5877548.1 response regulator transcription factor [Clostridiales bacterium]MDU0939749.1 response regulator transcription factor [Clostridiales bacterium]MDU1042101.1 response regulator transcription factor [Clostridiales bacterium]MDU3489850.1 response regulator transcription factor [Clostridiales bacterium]